jgi:hypothetical protein
MRRDGTTGILLVIVLLSLASCFGVSADISVREDGSGKIALEYRVSRLAEALGKLDGNSRWQTVPVGRADFERTVARLPGMRLISFSARETPSGGAANGGDIINKAELEFKDLESLLAFLDASGKRAVFVRENGGNRLSLTLMAARSAEAVDHDLLTLLREVSRGYELRLSFSAPGTASLSVTPGTVPAARIVSPGKQVSFSIETGELLGVEEGLTVEIIWPLD